MSVVAALERVVHGGLPLALVEGLVRVGLAAGELEVLVVGDLVRVDDLELLRRGSGVVDRVDDLGRTGLRPVGHPGLTVRFRTRRWARRSICTSPTPSNFTSVTSPRWLAAQLDLGVGGRRAQRRRRSRRSERRSPSAGRGCPRRRRRPSPSRLRTESEATAAAAPIKFRQARRVARCPGPTQPLFLRPAGLAVGLAPKERRYGPSWVRFAPGRLRRRPFGSPAPRRQTAGDSAGDSGAAV